MDIRRLDGDEHFNTFTISIDNRKISIINIEDNELFKELVKNEILVPNNDENPTENHYCLEKEKLHQYCCNDKNFARSLVKNFRLSRIIPPGEQIKHSDNILSKFCGAVIGGVLGFFCGLIKAYSIARNGGQKSNRAATAATYLGYGPVRGWCHGWRGGITQVHKGCEATLTALELSRVDEQQDKYLLPWNFYHHKDSIADMSEEKAEQPFTPRAHFLGRGSWTELTSPNKTVTKISYEQLPRTLPVSPRATTDHTNCDALTQHGHPVFDAAPAKKPPTLQYNQRTLRL